WRRTLHDGIVANSALPVQTVEPQAVDWPEPAPEPTEMEVVFRPDPGVWDGRYSNNGWLQELPKPFTKLTWDNAALISPAAAERLALDNGDVVRLHLNGEFVEAPVLVLPGQADDSVTVHFGYGRSNAGAVGDNLGFNAYRLFTNSPVWFASGLEVEPTR